MQLLKHLFPGLGIVRNLCEIQGIQRQPAGFEALVVAGNAVLIHDLALCPARRNQHQRGDPQTLRHLFS
jgi:hypothetical protein